VGDSYIKGLELNASENNLKVGQKKAEWGKTECIIFRAGRHWRPEKKWKRNNKKVPHWGLHLGVGASGISSIKED